MRDEYPTTGGTIDVMGGGRMGLNWQYAEGESMGIKLDECRILDRC